MIRANDVFAKKKKILNLSNLRAIVILAFIDSKIASISYRISRMKFHFFFQNLNSMARCIGLNKMNFKLNFEI